MTEPRFNEVVNAGVKTKGWFAVLVTVTVIGEVLMAWLSGGYDAAYMAPIPLAFGIAVFVLSFGHFGAASVQVDDRQISIRSGRGDRAYPLGWIADAKPCRYHLRLRRRLTYAAYWFDAPPGPRDPISRGNLVLGTAGDIFGPKEAVLLEFHDGRKPVIVHVKRREELISAIKTGIASLPEDVRVAQRALLKGEAVLVRSMSGPMIVSGSIFIIASVGFIFATGAHRVFLAPLIVAAVCGAALIALAKPVGESYPGTGKVLLGASWMFFILLALGAAGLIYGKTHPLL